MQSLNEKKQHYHKIEIFFGYFFFDPSNGKIFGFDDKNEIVSIYFQSLVAHKLVCVIVNNDLDQVNAYMRVHMLILFILLACHILLSILFFLSLFSAKHTPATVIQQHLHISSFADECSTFYWMWASHFKHTITPIATSNSNIFYVWLLHKNVSTQFTVYFYDISSHTFKTFLHTNTQYLREIYSYIMSS